LSTLECPKGNMRDGASHVLCNDIGVADGGHGKGASKHPWRAFDRLVDALSPIRQAVNVDTVFVDVVFLDKESHQAKRILNRLDVPAIKILGNENKSRERPLMQAFVIGKLCAGTVACGEMYRSTIGKLMIVVEQPMIAVGGGRWVIGERIIRLIGVVTKLIPTVGAFP